MNFGLGGEMATGRIDWALFLSMCEQGHLQEPNLSLRAIRKKEDNKMSVSTVENKITTLQDAAGDNRLFVTTATLLVTRKSSAHDLRQIRKQAKKRVPHVPKLILL